MAAFVREESSDRYMVAAIGAESNVAVGVAQLGCRSRWISRLGDDELGHLIEQTIAGYGVDVHVEWDRTCPTGVCVKEFSSAGTRVRYYRNESAARSLGTRHARDLEAARWIHATGITPALSPTAAEVVAAICQHRPAQRSRVSFDVNYRPALWQDAAQAASVLIPLARDADLVFIGDDEAMALVGSSDEDELVHLLLRSDEQELVLKRGGGHATVITSAGRVSEPALGVPVVDVTGAGDAFAAGYLAGHCWGWQTPNRLRLGHFFAARILGVPGDLGPAIDNGDVEQVVSSVKKSVPRESARR